MTNTPTLTYIQYEKKHYNRNCNYVIPAGWSGILEFNSSTSACQSTKIIRSTPEEVVEAAEQEGFNIDKRVRQFVWARKNKKRSK